MTTVAKLNKRGDYKLEEQHNATAKLSPFHSWLIRQRRYCEYKTCMETATHVKNINGKDEVRCDFHK